MSRIITDETIKQKLSEYENITDLRQHDLNLYQLARRKGLLGDLKSLTKSKYKEEDLIEWISGFKTIKEMRADSNAKYTAAFKMNLQHHFPPKLKRSPAMDQQSVEKRNVIRERAKDKEKLMRKFKTLKKDDPEYKPRVSLFNAVEIDGSLHCGRCFKSTELSKYNPNTCRACYSTYMSSLNSGRYMNKWNVKDEYCNTIITHYEKTFAIGVKVDERLESYLRKIGYEFMFKEVYDK